MVDWQSPNDISNELGTLIPFLLSILSVIIFLFLPLNLLSLVEAANKFAHVVDGLYLCDCFLPIDRYHFYPPKLTINYDSWEFICNLGFEYGLLRGRRQWRWTAAVCTPPHHTTNANTPTRFPNSSTSPVGSLHSPLWLEISLA